MVEVKCNRCGKSFKKHKSQIGKNNYCSRECVKRRVKVNCKKCDKTIELQNYKVLKTGNFCSVYCRNEYQKTFTGSKNHFYGKKHTQETKERISQKKRGVKTTKRVELISVECSYCGKHKEVTPYIYKRSENHFCSIECHGKWKSIYNVGENNVNYNFDLSEEERKIRRNYPEYYSFLKEVLDRDNHNCVVCQRKDSLCVHHKDAYHWCKERRTDVSNGVTLCTTCHNHFHSIYTYRNNTEDQFINFYNQYANTELS